MGRPRSNNPTPAELEVLDVIWSKGPSTVREVMKTLNKKRSRAYTSIMSLMSSMAEKGLLEQKTQGKAYTYHAKVTQEKTRARMLKDLVKRAFDGSAAALVAQLLQDSNAGEDELDEINRTIQDFVDRKKNS